MSPLLAIAPVFPTSHNTAGPLVSLNRRRERLMAAARNSSRYGHRGATMILIGYRHGLRASELCDLPWSPNIA